MSCEAHRQKALKAIAAAFPDGNVAELESVFRAGQLQRADIGSLHSALRAAEQYEVWQTAMKTARDLYGSKAHRVEVVGGDENDEQLRPEVTNLIAYDVNGKQLECDPSLPYFQNTFSEEGLDPNEADLENLAADHIAAMFDHIQGVAKDGDMFYADAEPEKPPVVYLMSAENGDVDDTPASAVDDFLADKELQASVEDDDTSLLDYFNDEDAYRAWLKEMEPEQASAFELAWEGWQANHDNDYYIECMTDEAKKAVAWAKAREDAPVKKTAQPKKIRPQSSFAGNLDAKTLARIRAGKIADEDQKAVHQIALAVYHDKRDRLLPAAKKALSRQYPPREFQRLVKLSKSRSVKISQLGEVSKFELSLARWAMKETKNVV